MSFHWYFTPIQIALQAHLPSIVGILYTALPTDSENYLLAYKINLHKNLGN